MGEGFAERFYGSNAWKECRKAYRKSKMCLCERCLKEGRIVIGDEVHHKTRLSPTNISDPNISLSFNNLELLCRECHEKEHGKLGMRTDNYGHVEV